LTDEVKKIREMVELPLIHPEIFDKLGIEPPKGVLLHGPPGAGKTLLAKAVANETESNFILLNGPEVMSKFYGESEKKIRDIFDDAEKNAPSIIFIDEIDAIAPKREDVQGEVERRVVSQLLTMMDGLKSRGKVVVIGATNRINSLDPALRRPGRFDREVEISVPDKAGRLNILKIHTRNMPLAKNVNLDYLAGKTHGFVGADISALAKEAAMSVLRKLLPELKIGEGAVPKETLDKIIIKGDDFDEALKVVRPSAMREVLVETPNVGWNDIGGLENTKRDLIEAVELPIKNPEAFKRLGIRPPRGVLLYGPPGTGKTLLAKAVAKESEANFIQVKGPSLLSMWVGKSEEGVRKIFERARQVAPCIIFFDEIDSLAGKRGLDMGNKVTERVLNQLLAEMDGLEDLKDITIIGATNRPDMLDGALMRPGRFDRIILVDVPDLESRKKIFQVHLKNTPIDKNVNIDEMVSITEGFVGADIEGLVREASMSALRRDINSKFVTREDFDEALKRVKASVSPESAKRYKKMEEYYLKSAKAGLEVGPIYTG
jgi:transitional endoplasmic reticulum ATPase